ncbi:MAG: hypothetical protein E7457_02520 [Ruminococcaceae bacterium]|nr:hypothetical protein [Oscillospiraceae bacterium]
MNKFFDYLEMDLSLRDIRELLGYIRRFMAAVAGEIPVEGKLGRCGFCASPEGDRVRVHWVQVGRQRIAMDAIV